MVRKGRDDFFLVDVPAIIAGKPVSEVRAYVGTNAQASRVVWAGPSHLTVLVGAAAAGPKEAVQVYPVPGDAQAAPATAGLCDPAPLSGFARRTAGMDFPATLDDVKTLESRCDGQGVGFSVSDFSKLPATFKEWYRGDWTRKNHLVDLQTWLLVPSDGDYLFGLAGGAPAWLLVDGRPVLSHPAGQPYDKWTSGEAFPLKAGLRRVQVRTVVRKEIDTGLAWKRAGEQGTAANVAMVTGGDLKEGRWEWQGQRLHPFAEVACGKAYRFEGVDETFVPVVLEDETACWGADHVARWSLESGVKREALGVGGTVATVLRKSQLPAAVKVTARAATGEQGDCERRLVYDGPVWGQYGLTTRVTDVPAVCYADDNVNPVIRIRTLAPDGLAYTLETAVEWADGGCSNRSDTVVTERGWARVYLSGMEVSTVKQVSWSLRHCGAELDRGALRFVREPYGVLPDAVSGETLKAGGDFVVLVAPKASRGDPVEAVRDPGTNGMVLLDGFVFGGTPNVEYRTLNAQQEAEGLNPESSNPGLAFRVVDLRAVEQCEAASGVAALLPFAAVKEVLPAGVVVYAPSLSGLSREGGTSRFERRLSAMVGLLTGPASGSPRVLLVVPPAFDVLPDCGCSVGHAPCKHAAEARAFAAAVVRVADAHGVETVDLFTAFQTAGNVPPLVANGALTSDGEALALALIGKKTGAPSALLKSATQRTDSLVQ